ncbi:putative MFS-family transport protein [Klebsiella pneumoniae subsp. pneumoniae]|nr:putative MFS-family transport protein [Klebsiella pneumoniae subsp. pneumoniae]
MSPAAQMSDANTLFSTASQLAVGLGITLGAIGIRLGEQGRRLAASY